MNRHILFLITIGSFCTTYSMSDIAKYLRGDFHEMEIAQAREDIHTLDDVKNDLSYKTVQFLLQTLQEKVHAQASLKELQDIATPYQEKILGSKSLLTFVTQYQDYTDVLEYMLQQGVDPNEPNASPLFSAIQQINVEGVRLLLKHGADILQENDTSIFGNNTLMRAVNKITYNKNNSTIVTLLLNHKDSGQLVNKKHPKTFFVKECTPLHVLMSILTAPLTSDDMKSFARDSITMLLEHGANPYICNEDDEDVITIATNADLHNLADQLQQKHSEYNEQFLHPLFES